MKNWLASIALVVVVSGCGNVSAEKSATQPLSCENISRRCTLISAPTVCRSHGLVANGGNECSAKIELYDMGCAKGISVEEIKADLTCSAE